MNVSPNVKSMLLHCTSHTGYLRRIEEDGLDGAAMFLEILTREHVVLSPVDVLKLLDQTIFESVQLWRLSRLVCQREEAGRQIDRLLRLVDGELTELN